MKPVVVFLVGFFLVAGAVALAIHQLVQLAVEQLLRPLGG